MIEPRRPRLPIIRQCELLALNQSGVYYRPAPKNPANLTLLRLIDKALMECPFCGSRRWSDTSGGRVMRSAASGFPG